MKYAVVKDGIVKNVIEWDGRELLVGLTGADFIRSDTAGIGDRYENGAFVAPELTPEEIAAIEAEAEKMTEEENENI